MKPWKVIRLAALIILKLLLGLEAKGYTSEAKGYTSEAKTGSIHQHSAPESSNKNRLNYSNNHSLYDLSAYGYTKTWTSSQFGFLVSPSYAHIDDVGYVSFDGISSVEECAAKCHFKRFAGGEYGYDFAPQRCYCFKTIECREPRMLEKGAILFANSDPTYYDMSDYSSYISDPISSKMPPVCPQSFCDYFYYQNQEFCDSRRRGYRDTPLANKLYQGSSEGYRGDGAYYLDDDLNMYGYKYKWPSEHGFLVGKPLEDYKEILKPNYYLYFTNIESVSECAHLCSIRGAISGEYGYRRMQNRCYCLLEHVPNNKLNVWHIEDVSFEYCSEPSIVERDAIIFSARPKPQYCDLSYCDYYFESNKAYCTSPILEVRPEPLLSPLFPEDFDRQTTGEIQKPSSIQQDKPNDNVVSPKSLPYTQNNSSVLHLIPSVSALVLATVTSVFF